MTRTMLKAKLHRLTVTQAELHYDGSITIDADLLAAADIVPFEAVHVWNVTRGSRFQTYAMQGEAGSGVVCINGAAAHLTHPGDLIIVATFCGMEASDVAAHKPTIILVDAKNRIRRAAPDPVDC